jgi:signal peptidase I
VRSFVRGLFWIAGILGAMGLLLHLFLFDTWVIPGDDRTLASSVEPTLAPGDRILVQRGSVPHRGQLARCTYANGAVVIGRVVAHGGEQLEIKGGRAFVAGKPVANHRHGCEPIRVVHPASGNEVQLGCAVEDNGAWTYQIAMATQHPEPDRTALVPAGHLFLLSDNRHLHQDSRDFGPVDASLCEHVVFRLWGESYMDASRRNTILW